MTRGRGKDLNIPTSRALIQQRDYRARKAKYLSDLEERCRRAEAENEKLRKELSIARGGLPVPPRQATFNSEISEIAQATTELMQHLCATSASLYRFQKLAITDNQPLPSSCSDSAHTCPSLPLFPPSPTPYSPTTISFLSPHDDLNPQSYSPKPTEAPSKIESMKHSQTSTASPRSDEECCGGLIDCRHLVDDESIEDNPLVNNSSIRSTSLGVPIL